MKPTLTYSFLVLAIFCFTVWWSGCGKPSCVINLDNLFKSLILLVPCCIVISASIMYYCIVPQQTHLVLLCILSCCSEFYQKYRAEICKQQICRSRGNGLACLDRVRHFCCWKRTLNICKENVVDYLCVSVWNILPDEDEEPWLSLISLFPASITMLMLSPISEQI